MIRLYGLPFYTLTKDNFLIAVDEESRKRKRAEEKAKVVLKQRKTQEAKIESLIEQNISLMKQIIDLKKNERNSIKKATDF